MVTKRALRSCNHVHTGYKHMIGGSGFSEPEPGPFWTSTALSVILVLVSADSLHLIATFNIFIHLLQTYVFLVVF